jgi:hypothetical protein
MKKIFAVLSLSLMLFNNAMATIPQSILEKHPELARDVEHFVQKTKINKHKQKKMLCHSMRKQQKSS